MKPTFMIVEDEKSIAVDTANRLKLCFDCDVIVETTGDNVIDMLKSKPVHFLLQDIHVPGPSGFELIKQIKKLGFKLEIYVITSWDEDSYYKKCDEVGVVYIAKPIDFKILIPDLTEKLKKSGLDYLKK